MTMFAAGTPAAITPRTTSSTSSLFDAIVAPCLPAMPFGLMATLSSLCTNFANAWPRSALPVRPSIARWSMRRAASSVGQRPFACNVFARVTLTILPGIDSGTKPDGGRATRLDCAAASPMLANIAAPAARDGAEGARRPMTPR